MNASTINAVGLVAAAMLLMMLLLVAVPPADASKVRQCEGMSESV